MKLQSSSSMDSKKLKLPDFSDDSPGDDMERSGVLGSASASAKKEGGGLNVNLMPPSSTSPTNSWLWS